MRSTMRYFAMAALVIAGSLTANATAAEPDKSADLEVAAVNGDPITIRDLRSQFKNRHGGHAKFLGGEEELRTFLGIAIEDRLLLQEAYEIGLDSDPAVKIEADAFEDGKAADFFVTTEVEKKSVPTTEEIREVWQKYGDFLVQIREIGVRTRVEADEIRNGLLHGADVEKLARTCSLLKTRQRGGLRMAGWGNGDPAREAVILALDAGDVSQVLEIDGGFEVLVVEGRVDAMRPEFETVREAIGAILGARKKEAREKAISAEVWQKYHAVVVTDTSLPAFRATFESNPETVVAKWDGGQLKAGQVMSRSELTSLADMLPAAARLQVESRIRATSNSLLFALEARARKLNEAPEVAGPSNDFREKLMLDALYGEHILKGFKLADGEVRAYYDEHKTDFSEPEKRLLAQILMPSESGAKAIEAQLAKGADFAQLAKSKSLDITTAPAGGELGWVAADHVPPTFKAVLQLGKGKVAKSVQTSAGWHLIRVNDIQPKRQLSFDESKERAATTVSELKKRELRKAWLTKLNAAAKIEINDAAIREFVKENPLNPNTPAPSMQHAMDGMPAGHGSGNH